MPLSNPAKYFLATLLLLFLSAGCSLLSSENKIAGRGPEEPKGRLPFKTKEPESFQCEIIETAGGVQRKKRLAKKGTRRRVDLDYGEPTQRALLQTDGEYILDIGRGLYAESRTGSAEQFSELTHELLYAGERAEFRETSRNGSIVVYTVHPVDSGSSEIVIHYDESVGMPVKQEFFSIADGTRTLSLTVELVNFKAEPDADLFSIPAAFKKVSVEELLNVPAK
ncbi:MAG: hypothetical protein AB7F88_07125 [Pyrinomonadaceae bacterium]